MNGVIAQMDEAIDTFLLKYEALSETELLDHRYARFRSM